MFTEWKQATGNLPAGTQRVLLDTLNLVANEQVKVVWGANDFNGSPCLINAVGCMLADYHGNPSLHERELVQAFDRVCANMRNEGIITDKYLSGLGADFLIRNFGELKPLAQNVAAVFVPESPITGLDVMSDTDFANLLLTMNADETEVDEIIEDHVKALRKSE